MAGPVSQRWDALDILRGITVIAMLLNLNPGAWDQEYRWLDHARWQGGHLIDMVAPAFLFCIGAVLPLSLGRRIARGAAHAALVGHILWRSLALVAIGLFFNLYPSFDWAHMRIPGVLQRIGLDYGMVALLVLATARRDGSGKVRFSTGAIAAAAGVVLVSYWALLYFVPVPGFGAPRFDPVGSWPAVVDRWLIGPDHMFIYWPVDGKVVFDPEGLISLYPATFNVLLGVLVGLVHAEGRLKRPALWAVAAGSGMMLLAIALDGVCPIVKNIWTSSFALFSGGFAVALLGGLAALLDRYRPEALLFPARLFGANPLLAYILSFAISPLLDIPWIGRPDGPIPLRRAGQEAFQTLLPPHHASFVFGLVCVGAIGLILLFCHRRRWILKL